MSEIYDTELEAEFVGDIKYNIVYEGNLPDNPENRPNRFEPRSCGDCTKCCEGWLSGVAHGKAFYPGKPCQFKGKTGCTIYKDRPHDPCVTYSCAWLRDKYFELPDWIKPSECDAIIDILEWSPGKHYISVVEAGKKLDASVLWWATTYSQQNNMELAVQISGGWNYLGCSEFINTMQNGIGVIHVDD
jgi:hypothetical protein